MKISEDTLTFNLSVRGAGHIKNGKPCQDWSISWQSQDKGSIILIVCDGHGGDSYIRSDTGARLAAEVTLKTIKEFISQDNRCIFGKKGEVTARNTEKQLSNDTAAPESMADMTEMERQQYVQHCLFLKQVSNMAEQDAVFERLFETIYSSWLGAIEQDAADRPFTDAENAIRGTGRTAKAYGCTLMAYVQTPLYWFAFHIGDGRLLACNRVMKWKQIVPWDCSCFQNFTTSLCNHNPVPSFRYAFDATGNFPAAVFCCSDGVEDSWGDYELSPERLHNYYTGLIRVFHDEGKECTVKKLEDFLPLLSKRGSKDDMSLAGYINLKAMSSGIEAECIKDKIELIQKEKDRRQDNYNKLLKDIEAKEAELKSMKESLLKMVEDNAAADMQSQDEIEVLNRTIYELADKIRLEKSTDLDRWREMSKEHYEDQDDGRQIC